MRPAYSSILQYSDVSLESVHRFSAFCRKTHPGISEEALSMEWLRLRPWLRRKAVSGPCSMGKLHGIGFYLRSDYLVTQGWGLRSRSISYWITVKRLAVFIRSLVVKSQLSVMNMISVWHTHTHTHTHIHRNLYSGKIVERICGAGTGCDAR